MMRALENLSTETASTFLEITLRGRAPAQLQSKRRICEIGSQREAYH